MKSQHVKTPFATAELSDQDGVLILESPTESVSLHGHVAAKIDLILLYNERELFSGTVDELESDLEAVRALKQLRGNHTMRQMLTQLADNGNATALLAYLNQE